MLIALVLFVIGGTVAFAWRYLSSDEYLFDDILVAGQDVDPHIDPCRYGNWKYRVFDSTMTIVTPDETLDLTRESLLSGDDYEERTFDENGNMIAQSSRVDDLLYSREAFTPGRWGPWTVRTAEHYPGAIGRMYAYTFIKYNSDYLFCGVDGVDSVMFLSETELDGVLVRHYLATYHAGTESFEFWVDGYGTLHQVRYLKEDEDSAIDAYIRITRHGKSFGIEKPHMVEAIVDINPYPTPRWLFD